MKGIDAGYKLSELLSGRGGSADAIVNVTAVEFRLWGVVDTFDTLLRNLALKHDSVWPN